MFKKILIIFILWKTMIIILSLCAVRFLPLNIEFSAYKNFGLNVPYLVWIWGNFDGVHYLNIAQRGYQGFEHPFFPLFPFLIKIIQTITKFPYIVVGQMISNTAFLISLYLMTKLLYLEKTKISLFLFLIILLLFPTSFFLGSVYNDSLFLLFSTLTIYQARKKNWFWAGLSAFFATLTRLNGIVLALFLIVEYFFPKLRISKKYPSFFKIWPAILPILAFMLYLIFVQIKFGDWSLVFSDMKIWHQDKMIFPLQTIWRYLKILLIYPTFKLNYWVALLELFSFLFYILIIIFSYKKIRLSYWVLLIFSILIPSLTGTFQGMPRYGLHLFPLFLALTIFLKSKSLIVKSVYFTISLALLFFCLTLFTRGYFIA